MKNLLEVNSLPFLDQNRRRMPILFEIISLSVILLEAALVILEGSFYFKFLDVIHSFESHSLQVEIPASYSNLLGDI
jgi:hypothetical protein